VEEWLKWNDHSKFTGEPPSFSAPLIDLYRSSLLRSTAAPIAVFQCLVFYHTIMRKYVINVATSHGSRGHKVKDDKCSYLTGAHTSLLKAEGRIEPVIISHLFG
jgi:hypothetical protein